MKLIKLSKKETVEAFIFFSLIVLVILVMSLFGANLK